MELLIGYLVSVRDGGKTRKRQFAKSEMGSLRLLTPRAFSHSRGGWTRGVDAGEYSCRCPCSPAEPHSTSNAIRSGCVADHMNARPPNWLAGMNAQQRLGRGCYRGYRCATTNAPRAVTVRKVTTMIDAISAPSNAAAPTPDHALLRR